MHVKYQSTICGKAPGQAEEIVDTIGQGVKSYIHTYILPLITTYSHDNVHYDILYCFCSTRYSFLKDDCVKEVESLEEVYKRGDIAESKYLILKGFKSHLGDSELVWNIPSPADTLVLSKAYYAYHKGNEASSSSL